MDYTIKFISPLHDFKFQCSFFLIGIILILFSTQTIAQIGNNTEKEAWQSVICSGVSGGKAWNDQMNKVQNLEELYQNAIKKHPNIPTKVIYRSLTPVVTRFDDRWDIIAEIIENRGTDNYLINDFKYGGHIMKFLNLAKQDLKHPKDGFSFSRADLLNHHLFFKDRVDHIKHHRDKALSETKLNKDDFKSLMEEVIPTDPLAAGSLKTLIFTLNKALGPPAKIAKGIGVLSLIKSSYDILVALSDLETLNIARLKNNLFLQSLEDFAYLNSLYKKYMAIYDRQDQILNCKIESQGDLNMRVFDREDNEIDYYVRIFKEEETKVLKGVSGVDLTVELDAGKYKLFFSVDTEKIERNVEIKEGETTHVEIHLKEDKPESPVDEIQDESLSIPVGMGRLYLLAKDGLDKVISTDVNIYTAGTKKLIKHFYGTYPKHNPEGLPVDLLPGDYDISFSTGPIWDEYKGITVKEGKAKLLVSSGYGRLKVTAKGNPSPYVAFFHPGEKVYDIGHTYGDFEVDLPPGPYVVVLGMGEGVKKETVNIKKGEISSVSF